MTYVAWCNRTNWGDRTKVAGTIAAHIAKGEQERYGMSGRSFCAETFERLLLMDGRRAVVLGRSAAELPLEGFGKIGRIIETYLQGDFRDVPALSLNKVCGSVEPRPLDQLARWLTDQGFYLLEEN
jgi:hypothetical protein